VPGASLYQVQVSPNGEWTNNTVTLPNSGTTVNDLYEMPLSLPHDSYFWRVRAEVGGTWGPYSNPRSFLREWEDDFTILKSPTAADPTITWTPVKEASEYEVLYCTAQDCNTTGSNKRLSCWTNQTSFTPYDLAIDGEEKAHDCSLSLKNAAFLDGLPAGTLFWSVIPWDDSTAAPLEADSANDGAWVCETAQPECDADYQLHGGTFTYQTPTPGAVSGTVTGLNASWHTSSLTATTCDATTPCPITPTLSWNAVAGARSYHVHIYRDAGLTNTYRAYNTDWPELTPRDSFFDAQAGKPFYWTVTASGTSGVAFSNIKTFAKVSSPVTLSSPASGATLHGRNVTFNWSDFQNTGAQGAYDARNYDLQISKTSRFDSPLLDQTDIDLTQFTNPTGGLADGTYFWRVAPIDQSGNVLTWSSTRSVTVNATGPTVKILSKNGIPVTGPIVVKLSEPISGVSKSTVQIVPKHGGGGAVAGKLKLGANSTTYVFKPKQPLVTGQTYVLRVSPSLVDGNGNSLVVTGGGVRTATVAKNTSPAWKYSQGWSRHHASGARSGSYVSAKSGHSAALKVVGSKATLYACKGPDMGKISVSVGGQTQTVSEHQSFTKCGVAIWHQALGAGVANIVVKVSKGTGNLDEVVVK
jgi:hypothetical protein